MSSEQELENTGLALTSGTAGTLLIFSVLILNIPYVSEKSFVGQDARTRVLEKKNLHNVCCKKTVLSLFDSNSG